MEDLRLTLRERAAVAVAAQVWGQASAGPLASTALRKLESTPGTADTWAPADLRGTVALTSSDAALLPLMSAIRLERDVVFPYRTPSSDAPQTRTVSPWALRSSQGRWLLVGHDADRGALRTFRVSRITGPVTVTARERSMAPTIDFDPASVTQGDEPPAVARVRAERGRAVSVRQHAVHGSPGDEDLQVQAATREALVSILCGGGADVVVLDPPEIVEAVREALAAVARAHEVHS
jgi:proteasome accessory factor B